MNHSANQLCIHPLRNIYENIYETCSVIKHEKHNVIFSIVYTIVQDNLSAKWNLRWLYFMPLDFFLTKENDNFKRNTNIHA